jgi:hypothetical protein
MKHSLLIILTLLQFALGTNQVSAQTTAKLKNDWTKLEIGFVLESDNGDNSRISGSCVRFLKIENSDKILQEVCLYKKGNTDPKWSCVETKKVSLIDHAKMEAVIKKFDELFASEKQEWRSTPDSEKTKRIRDSLTTSKPVFRSHLSYRIERNKVISTYGSHAGGSVNLCL